MPSVIYTDSSQIPGTVSGFDLVVIDLDVSMFVQVNEVSHILLRKSRTLSSGFHGLELLGPSTTVTNEGTIEAGFSGITLTGQGALTVINLGKISSWNAAIVGGNGNDRILNAGTLETEDSDPNSPVLELMGGNDFYDGILG